MVLILIPLAMLIQEVILQQSIMTGQKSELRRQKKRLTPNGIVRLTISSVTRNRPIEFGVA